MAKLPPQKFFAYSGGKFTSYEWQPPDVRDDATTEDLANIHGDFHHWILRQHGPDAPEVRSQVAIDNNGVRSLLRQAFLASLRTDEDRPTRATLYVEHPSDPKSLRVITFQEAYDLTDARIARLAPALGGDDAALVVVSHEGRLLAGGIAHLDDRHSESQPFVPPQGWAGRRGGIFVGILGPGIITIRQGYCDYTLERNRVVGHVAPAAVPPVDDWLCEVQKSLLGRASKAVEENPFFFREENVHQDLDFVLARVLETAARLRHGAAIVIPPDATAPIRVNYRTDGRHSLKELVQNFWEALGNAYAAKDTKEAPNALARCERKRHAMLKQAAALGRLTATDGCVVLDRSFQIRGFGGIIDPSLTPEQSNLEFVPPASDLSLTEDSLLRRFGTRHRSAYLLCKSCPGTLAFVLSQDGGWRVFASDLKNVYFFDHVSP